MRGGSGRRAAGRTPRARLQLLLFGGLSALPFEMLDGPADGLAAVARDRAAIAIALDLIDATS